MGRVSSCLAPLVALLLLLGAPGPYGRSAGAAEPTDAVAGAWSLFRSYHEDLERIDRARALLEAEAARRPTRDALVLLAWVHLSWGDHRARTPEEKLRAYEQGREAARRAVELDPRSADAHFWYAANLGRWALARGKLRAAFLVGTLREEIETVLRLDPQHVGGLALAGSFYLETPGFLGGDVSKAEEYLRRALALDPHFTRARLELARCLIAQRRLDEARGELRRVLEESRPTYYADWVVRHRPAAERLLATLAPRS